MRIVDPGEGCPRFESTCETLAGLGRADGPPAAAEEAAMRAHAAACEECAGTVRAFEALRRSRAAFEAPEPDASYWAGFSERLDVRLRASDAGVGVPAAKRRRARRAGLAVAASAALVAGVLGVRHMRRIEIVPPVEAELLEKLDRASEDRIVEYLDEIAPPELGAAPEDLAEAGDLLHEDGAAGMDDETPYDLFFDLGDEDRDQLLEEMRGEIG
jgi:hypothetical protein